MTKIAYEDWSPKAAALAAVEQANKIIAEYEADGFDLTLRQLYYQFVSRDLLPNKQSEYKRLGDIVSRARRAGLISWDAIVDRTRHLRTFSSWESPRDIVESCAAQFKVNPWLRQDWRVEVWFEKDALLGVFERACEDYRIPYFSCRGYASDSEVWAAARRLRACKKDVLVLHFGDHDPSGVDMSRDLADRIALFRGGSRVEIRRIALTMDQVEEHQPPPNPAKETDSRFEGYRQEYGDESWELDALDPRTLAELVEREVREVIDQDSWDEAMAEEEAGRDQLKTVAASMAAGRAPRAPVSDIVAALELSAETALARSITVVRQDGGDLRSTLVARAKSGRLWAKDSRGRSTFDGVIELASWLGPEVWPCLDAFKAGQAWDSKMVVRVLDGETEEP